MPFTKGNKHGKKFSLGKALPRRPTLGKLKAKAWALLSRYVRRSHADEGGTVECYTCGKLMFWKESHAGHAIPGRHGAVLLDAEIIRPQCPIDNLWKGGCYEIFAAKLIRENGLEWFERKLEGARQVRKWNRAELEEFIEEYKGKLKALDADLHRNGRETTDRGERPGAFDREKGIESDADNEAPTQAYADQA